MKNGGIGAPPPVLDICGICGSEWRGAGKGARRTSDNTVKCACGATWNCSKLFAAKVGP